MEKQFLLGAHLRKTRSAPKKNYERTRLKLAFQSVDSKSLLAWKAILWVTSGCSPGIVGCKERLAWRAIRPRRWRREPQRRRRTLSCCSDSAEVRWSLLWGRGMFFCSRHTLQGAFLVFFSSTQVPSKSKNVGWKSRFCLFPPNPTFIFFASPQSYTLCRKNLHSEGFCVGFAHQTLHT